MAIYRDESELARQQKAMADNSSLQFKKGVRGVAQRAFAANVGYNPITGKKMTGMASKFHAWRSAFNPLGSAIGAAYMKQSTKGSSGKQITDKDLFEEGKESIGVHNIIGGTVLKAFGINIDGNKIAQKMQNVDRQANQDARMARKNDPRIEMEEGVNLPKESMVNETHPSPNGGVETIGSNSEKFNVVKRDVVSSGDLGSSSGSVITTNPDGSVSETSTEFEPKETLRSGGKIKHFANGGKFYYSKGGKFYYELGGEIKDNNVKGASIADEGVIDASIETAPKTFDVNEIKAGLAYIETGGETGRYKNPYGVVNKSSTKATGKYQYLPYWHQENNKAIQKFAVSKGYKDFKGKSNNEVMKMFKNSPKLQEEYTDHMILGEYTQTAKNKKYNAVLDKYGMTDTIALLHFAGANNVKKFNKRLEKDPNAYFQTPKGDAPNVTVDKYLSEYKKGIDIYKENRENQIAIKEGKFGTTERLDNKGNVVNVPIGDKSGGAYSAKNLPIFEVKGKNGMNMGGITKGKFSHKDNPLTVVDKEGNHTGMELTGEEGVFDKNAMNKIEALSSKGKFGALGRFIKAEMETWENTGTAVAGADMSEWYEKIGDDESIVAIKEGIHAIESSGKWKNKPYEAINDTSSATGKYQFLWNLHGKNITKQTGIKSKEEFLKSPEAQEKFMTWHINNSLIPAAKKLKIDNPNTEFSIEELMALTHFQGEKGADIFIKTGKDQGGKNVDVSTYIDKFNKGYSDAGGSLNEFTDNYITASDVGLTEEEDVIKFNAIQRGEKYEKDSSAAKLMEKLSSLKQPDLASDVMSLKATEKEIKRLENAIEQNITLSGYESVAEMDADLIRLNANRLREYSTVITKQNEFAGNVKAELNDNLFAAREELTSAWKNGEIDEEEYDKNVLALDELDLNMSNYIKSVGESYSKVETWENATKPPPINELNQAINDDKAEYSYQWGLSLNEDLNKVGDLNPEQVSLGEGIQKRLDELRKEVVAISTDGTNVDWNYDDQTDEVKQKIKEDAELSEVFGEGSGRKVVLTLSALGRFASLDLYDKVTLGDGKSIAQTVVDNENMPLLSRLKKEESDLNAQYNEIYPNGKPSDEISKIKNKIDWKVYNLDKDIPFSFKQNYNEEDEKNYEQLIQKNEAEQEDIYDNVSTEDVSMTDNQAPTSLMSSEELAKWRKENFDTANAVGVGGAIKAFGGVDNALQLVGMAAGYQAAINPVPEQKKSDKWMEQIQRTKDRMNLGLDANTKTMYQRNAERTYSYDAANIGRGATSGQSALGALGAASSRKYNADLQLASMDATAREQHFGDYQSALVRDEAMTQAMWERNEYNEASRKRDLKAGLIGQAVKNIRDNAMYEKSYGSGSAYAQLMRNKLIETKQTIQATEDSKLISQGYTPETIFEADKINRKQAEEEQNNKTSIADAIGGSFKNLADKLKNK